MKIGLIGLGHMGAAMAANLVRARHDVTVFDRSPGKARGLLELGAHEAARTADACNGEVVITMLGDETALAHVVLAEGGVIANLRKGAIHVSMGTISVAFSKELAEAHAAAGQRFVAAPVFGRADMAAAAKLYIVAAGDATAVNECKPLFDVLGQKTFPISTEPAAANLVKLSGNFLQAAAVDAFGEAVALVGRAGIDRRAFVDLLTSTIFTGKACQIFGGLIAEGNYQPPALAAPLGHEDIRIALEAVETVRAPMPLGTRLQDRFLRLLAEGGDKLDWAAIARLATQDAGAAQNAKSQVQ